MNITLYDIAMRFVGLREVPGVGSNPAVLAMLKLDGEWPQDDDVPWCSAFVNYCAWLLKLPRSKSLRARSWLETGRPIALYDAESAFDVVIFSRGGGDQPGPEVIKAPGHVGLFAGVENGNILVLGGNQGNAVNVSPYPASRLLGVRRLRSVLC
jgi:uncharacterized protein (TIGR02594 family)